MSIHKTVTTIFLPGLFLFLILVESASAWTVYNKTQWNIKAKMSSHEGGSTSCGAWDDADGIQIQSGQESGVHYTTSGCNPTNYKGNKRRATEFTMTILVENADSDLSDERGRFMCKMDVLGGGFIRVDEQARPEFDGNDPGNVRPNVYCVSYFAEDKGYNSADCSGDGDYDLNGDGYCQQLTIDHSDFYADENPENLNEMVPDNRNVRFLVGGDTQYWNNRIDTDNNDENYGVNETADVTMQSMIDQQKNNDAIRGIILSGDILHTQRLTELNKYKDILGNRSRFVYEGLGNHDVLHGSSSNGNSLWEMITGSAGRNEFYDFIGEKAHNTITTKRYGDNVRQFPHYSWDWHEVHFVQLNLFAADDPPLTEATDPDAQGEEMDPRDALQFLKDDLSENVGSSDRPVVLVHHYGFDIFSKGWSSEAQKVAYWNAIREYNVIAIFSGHSHQGDTAGPSSRRSDWKPVTQRTDPDNSDYQERSHQIDGKNDFIPTFNAAAARGPSSCDDLTDACLNGAFLDVKIDQCNQLIIETRDSFGDAYSTAVTVDFDTPLPAADICSHPDPIADAGGNRTVDQGGSILFAGTGTDVTDSHQNNLQFRWIIDGAQFPWGPSFAPSTTMPSPSPTQLFFFVEPTGIQVPKPEVKLEVKDAYGFIGSDTVKVTVNNVAPTISSSISDGATFPQEDLLNTNTGWALPSTATFDFTDPGGEDDGPYTCTFVYGVGGTPIVVTSDGPDVAGHSCNYGEDNPFVADIKILGNFLVTLQVEDKHGDSDTHSFNILIEDLVDPVISTSCPSAQFLEIGEDFACSAISFTASRDESVSSITAEIDYDQIGVGPKPLNIEYNQNSGYYFFNPPITHQFFSPTPTIGAEYTVVLTVTDSQNRSDSVTFEVEYTAPNNAPDITRGCDAPAQVEDLTLTLDATDEAFFECDITFWITADENVQRPHTAMVDFGDGSVDNDHITYFVGFDNYRGHYAPLRHTYTTAGIYDLSFTVSDPNFPGEDDSVSYVVTILEAPNNPPSLTLGTQSALANEGGAFNRPGSFSDSDADDSWQVTVDFGDGTVEPVSLSDKDFILSHVYRKSGDFTVTVIVDDGEDTDQTSFDIEVSNVNPVINHIIAPALGIGIDEEFTVTARWSDPGRTDDDPHEWTWSIDGQVQLAGTRAWVTGGNVARTVDFTTSIDTPGEYVFEFEMIDNDGGIGVGSTVITVLGEEIFETGFEE